MADDYAARFDENTFDDGKDAGALRTIGEVSKALDIKPHVLRYWEQQFDALQPLKRSGNRRYYRADDIALIQRIDRLVNREGYTLKGAQAALREAPSDERAIDRGGPEPVALPTDLLPRLKTIRDDLRAALAA
ncbi:MAG: MerR family transcriptional regulator [Erythrobacter sp.]|nr:MerR family transcriptional regulator [Erythrobacter sp.]